MDELQQKTARAIVNVFETGRVLGNYGALAVLKGDKGHLSYGRSQSTLGSGSLAGLLALYCAAPGARDAAAIRPFLLAVQRKDFGLDNDAGFRQVLKTAATDPVMQATQDRFFDDHYLAPACAAAQRMGILEPLGQTVVYDSFVQGGWGKLQPRLPSPAALGGARAWIARYLDVRTAWLKSLDPPLPSTTYRMASFAAMIAAGKWDLALPIVAHGVTITEAALAGGTPGPAAAGGPARVLTLSTPYLRGDDVIALQDALAREGQPIGRPDGIYGPFTDALVKAWQAAHQVVEAGVGAATRRGLHLAP